MCACGAQGYLNPSGQDSWAGTAWQQAAWVQQAGHAQYSTVQGTEPRAAGASGKALQQQQQGQAGRRAGRRAQVAVQTEKGDGGDGRPRQRLVKPSLLGRMNGGQGWAHEGPRVGWGESKVGRASSTQADRHTPSGTGTYVRAVARPTAAAPPRPPLCGHPASKVCQNHCPLPIRG